MIEDELKDSIELVKLYLDAARDIADRNFQEDKAETIIEIAKMVQMAHRWQPAREKDLKNQKQKKPVSSSVIDISQAPKIPEGTKRLYVDGGCYGNGTIRQVASIIVTTEDKILHRQVVGNKTNNEAEFLAIEAAMLLIQRDLTAEQPMVIWSDSQIAVNMVNGTWAGKKQHLVTLRERITTTKGTWENIQVAWLPRNKNFAGIVMEYGNFQGKKI